MRVLGVFAKAPDPGAVKTRLAQATSTAWASRVASALLADTLNHCLGARAKHVVAFTPAERRAWFETNVPRQFALQPQADGDLGARLHAFFTAQIAGGAEAVVVIGTDSPTLPIAYVEQAFALLDTADVVLGPASDGGYYLLGCGRRLPPVFAGIAWSAPTVLAETIRRLDDPGWRLAVLPPWYDVDTFADWQMLSGHVAALRRAGIDPGVPHTEALLHRPHGEENA